MPPRCLEDQSFLCNVPLCGHAGFMGVVEEVNNGHKRCAIQGGSKLPRQHAQSRFHVHSGIEAWPQQRGADAPPDRCVHRHQVADHRFDVIQLSGRLQQRLELCPLSDPSPLRVEVKGHSHHDRRSGTPHCWNSAQPYRLRLRSRGVAAIDQQSHLSQQHRDTDGVRLLAAPPGNYLVTRFDSLEELPHMKFARDLRDVQVG
mmetsp:Transcript_27860/g.64731  ORF Transcript_27860/g.64731 Transcript_27860/m.64731 type:complete len:202 (-) Transcript_27860:646-1251(-)